MGDQPRKPFYKRRWFWVTTISACLLIVVSLSAGSTQLPSPEQAVQPPVVTGFGATLGEWNAHHTADDRFATTAAYDPDPSLPDPSHNDRYLVNEFSHGRVLGYELRIPGTPDIQAAKSVSLEEFPPDTTVAWVSQRSQCYQMEVQSKLLGMALSDPAIGDATGTALVEFQSQVSGVDGAYDPNNNNDIFFSLGSYPTAQDAPAC
jgi:hypothetical protein